MVSHHDFHVFFLCLPLFASSMPLSESIALTTLDHKKNPFRVDKKGLLCFFSSSYLPRYFYLAGISTSIPHGRYRLLWFLRASPSTTLDKQVLLPN
jgi:hypothetical protein